MKKYLIISLILAFAIVSLSFAQSNPNKVKGKIEKIAENGSYIIIEDTTILTTQEFLDNAYLEVDDEIIITVEKTKEGLQAVDVEYIIVEEDWGTSGDLDWLPEFEASPSE
jgi:hypothetical protein